MCYFHRLPRDQKVGREPEILDTPQLSLQPGSDSPLDVPVSLLCTLEGEADQPAPRRLPTLQSSRRQVDFPGQVYRPYTLLGDRRCVPQSLGVALEKVLHLLERLEIELICGPVVGSGECCEADSSHENLVQLVVFRAEVGDLIGCDDGDSLPPGKLGDSPHPPPAPGRFVVGDLYVEIPLAEGL